MSSVVRADSDGSGLAASAAWARTQIRHGREIPFVRLGRRVRLTEAQLAQIIEGAVQAVPSADGRCSARSKL